MTGGAGGRWGGLGAVPWLDGQRGSSVANFGALAFPTVTSAYLIIVNSLLGCAEIMKL